MIVIFSFHTQFVSLLFSFLCWMKLNKIRLMNLSAFVNKYQFPVALLSIQNLILTVFVLLNLFAFLWLLAHSANHHTLHTLFFCLFQAAFSQIMVNVPETVFRYFHSVNLCLLVGIDEERREQRERNRQVQVLQN